MKICTIIIFYFCVISFSVAGFSKSCETVGLLGEFNSLTGRLSRPFGIQIKYGVEAAQLFLNSRTSVSRRCYQFKLFDINNSVANIPDIIRNTKGINYFIGLGLSDQAVVAREAVLEKKAILFSPTASSNLLSNIDSRIITMFPRNEKIAQFLAAQAWRRGIKRVAVLYQSSSSYSSNLANDFQVEFKKRGGLVDQAMQWSIGGLDLQRILTELKRTKTSHLFLPLFELDAAQVISYFHRSGFPISFIGTDAWGSQSTVIKKLTHDVPISAILPSIYDSKSTIPMNLALIRFFREAGSPEEPTDLGAFSFESLLLLDRMRARCSDKEVKDDLKKCLKKALPFDSTTGLISTIQGLNLQRTISIRTLSHKL